MAVSNPAQSAEALQDRDKDLSDPAGIAKELVSEAATDITEGISDAAEHLRYEKYLLEHSSGLAGGISNFARNHPIKALLIAAAAAFFVGTQWRFR